MQPAAPLCLPVSPLSNPCEAAPLATSHVPNCTSSMLFGSPRLLPTVLRHERVLAAHGDIGLLRAACAHRAHGGSQTWSSKTAGVSDPSRFDAVTTPTGYHERPRGLTGLTASWKHGRLSKRTGYDKCGAEARRRRVAPPPLAASRAMMRGWMCLRRETTSWRGRRRGGRGRCGLDFLRPGGQAFLAGFRVPWGERLGLRVEGSPEDGEVMERHDGSDRGQTGDGEGHVKRFCRVGDGAVPKGACI
ncbi:hypothetical protein P154DRAFT_340761 [Amniculicola lignicola CBS 123094]|uniref:Uncharacterized protein n=1 Tax=Amniculicola lignicola CBS 123094 TaxID=1392246 RepID=A0A6A5W324_9PLEO|nr:hypothetical protein P154DRAFT_340761 [Amniculicola lignicola CBS 123094]